MVRPLLLRPWCGNFELGVVPMSFVVERFDFLRFDSHLLLSVVVPMHMPIVVEHTVFLAWISCASSFPPLAFAVVHRWLFRLPRLPSGCDESEVIERTDVLLLRLRLASPSVQAAFAATDLRYTNTMTSSSATTTSPLPGFDLEYQQSLVTVPNKPGRPVHSSTPPSSPTQPTNPSSCPLFRCSSAILIQGPTCNLVLFRGLISNLVA
jgi:hypothetical protein